MKVSNAKVLKKLATTTGLFCTGVMVGFVVRSSESADYNTGYKPTNTEFNDSDYFTDEALKELAKKKKERHARKETKQND